MKIDFNFATQDGCLDKMVPSDLRQLVRERDELAARAERLRSAIGRFSAGVEPSTEYLDAIEASEDDFKILSDAFHETPAASLKSIQAKALRDVAYKLTFPPIIHDNFSKGYDQAISDVRAAADALEGEGDG
jgi:hypothetical protein